MPKSDEVGTVEMQSMTAAIGGLSTRDDDNNNNETAAAVHPRTIRRRRRRRRRRIIQNMKTKKKYRGGFSTSICDLFNNPRRRTDCCAIACCGLLSSDRTRYLLAGRGGGEHDQPPPRPNWTLRILGNVLFPIIMFMLIPIVTYGIPDSNTQILVLYILLLCWMLLCFIIYAKGKSKRMSTRRELISQIYMKNQQQLSELQLSEEGGGVDEGLDEGLDADAALALYIRSQETDTIRAHGLCSCFPKDAIYENSGQQDSSSEINNNNNNDLEADDDIDDDDDEEEASSRGGDGDDDDGDGDVCTCLWKFVSWCCCGGWGCWCQCCGCCAIGQEEREVNKLVSKAERFIDYVTFEPYADYYPALENLRLNRNKSLIAHYRRLSKLSIKMIKLLLSFIAFCGLLVLTRIDQTFKLENMLVVLATFCQAFLTLYFVHWKWHKFDLSLDAVVKYFACGFLLVTSLVILFEMIVQLLISIIFFLMVDVSMVADGTAEEIVENEGQISNEEEIIIAWTKSHPGMIIFLLFLTSFCVAALVEEIGKYFGYWMLEHPDFIPTSELEEICPLLSSSSSSSSNGVEEGGTSAAASRDDRIRRRKKSLNSLGAGVTVAMVSVAMGFACCENLIYLFIYSPPTIGSQVTTLLARSLFPVHPLCAAIQSIGICRRDIEGDKKHQLGKCIFLAILLHGSFDFILMTMEFLYALPNLGESKDDEEKDVIEDETEITFNWAEELPALLSSSFLVFIGMVYYLSASAAQKKRLKALEALNSGDAEYVSGSLLV